MTWIYHTILVEYHVRPDVPDLSFANFHENTTVSPSHPLNNTTFPISLVLNATKDHIPKADGISTNNIINTDEFRSNFLTLLWWGCDQGRENGLEEAKNICCMYALIRKSEKLVL